jgi:hypothetical protein
MKKTTTCLALLLLIFSCEKSGNTCNCDNPLEDLAWLKEVKDSFTNCACEISIFQATYKEKTVFYTTVTDPLCNSFSPIVLIDCTGTAIKSFEPNTAPIGTEITNRTVLYRCKTNK